MKLINIFLLIFAVFLVNSCATKTDKTAKKSLQDKILLDRTNVKKHLEDINSMVAGARAIPHFVDGDCEGLKFKDVKDDSFFSMVNLKDNDVLTAVNDEKVDSVSSMLQLFNKFKTENYVVFDIIREGWKNKLHYEIK